MCCVLVSHARWWPTRALLNPPAMLSRQRLASYQRWRSWSASIVGFLLFQENLTALQLLGGAIIVAASLGMELLGHANPPALEEKGTDAGNETAVKPR